MVMGSSARAPGGDRTNLRLAIFAVIIVAAFTALFSRLWFLQVLAADQYQQLAKENRVRLVHSEPLRGRILDRNGTVLVDNRSSLAVTINRKVLDKPAVRERVLKRLSKLLGIKIGDLEERLADTQVSQYKPVAIAYDVRKEDAFYILEHKLRFPGVDLEDLPVRVYPEGPLAAHVLGYVGPISLDDLETEYFADAKPAYKAGDVVGKLGVERSYDRHLRGRPTVSKMIVDSNEDVISSAKIQEGTPGSDLVLSLDSRIQRVSEDALAAGIDAAQGAGYQAPAGAAVVMDPNTGEMISMATYPTYDPAVLADGISEKEWAALGHATESPFDDALVNRTIQAQRQPGSTYKVVTAGAAMAAGVATPSTTLPCPPAYTYRDITFRNWTSLDYGLVDFARSLEISCDTFYYELGARLEDTFGAEEPFQKYARKAGIGVITGIDLPFEQEGRVPDRAWCTQYRRDTNGAGCADGWLPGYTVNMSIGQGDLVVTPLQMAVTYSAIANGGDVPVPHLGLRTSIPDEDDGAETVREFPGRTRGSLPLDDFGISVIQEGLVDVISGSDGTARGAFAGFPLDLYPLAGKTGTAELGESGLNDAWFVSYGPADTPEYVVAVYVERAGHGGESAGPIAREIWEGIFDLDETTDVDLARDFSG